MLINVNNTEKKNVIDQFKQDVARLGVSIEIPSDDNIRISSIKKIESALDTGTDEVVNPNTTVKITITKDDSEVEKTFEYRRLDYNHIRTHANLVDTNGHALTALEHNDAEAVDNTTTLNEAFKQGMSVTIERAPNVVKQEENDVTGITRYKFVANEDSLLYTGEVSLNVKVRDEDTGMYKVDGVKNYYTNTTNLTAATTEEIFFPVNATDIPENQFSGFTITRLNIPNKITTIGDGAFKNAIATLDNVVFGNKVESIGQDAFLGAVTATFRVPDNITYLEANALGSVTTFELDTLKKVELVATSEAGGNSATYKYTVNHDAGEADTEHATYGYIKIGTSKVYYTNEDLLNHKEVLSSATLGAKVNEVVIPNSVTTISGQFKNVVVPTINLNKVTIVEEGSFDNATITDLHIDPTVVTISSTAFIGATITNIHVDTNAEKARVQGAIPHHVDANYIVKNPDQQPPEPSEPSTVRSTGFNYSE